MAELDAKALINAYKVMNIMEKGNNVELYTRSDIIDILGYYPPDCSIIGKHCEQSADGCFLINNMTLVQFDIKWTHQCLSKKTLAVISGGNCVLEVAVYSDGIIEQKTFIDRGTWQSDLACFETMHVAGA